MTDPLEALAEGRTQPTPSFLRDMTVPAWVVADLLMAADLSAFRQGAKEAIAYAKGRLSAIEVEEKQ